MAWRIEFEAAARKELTRLDPQVARRIVAFLRDRVAPLEDPRVAGDALTGSRLGEFWRYRVGDYRILVHIDDGCLLVLVVRVGHRSRVHR